MQKKTFDRQKVITITTDTGKLKKLKGALG
jgi:hypothetical protein